MKIVSRILCLFFLFSMDLAAFPQISWDSQTGCFVQDGKAVFLSGVNYVPPKGWLLNLADPDLKAVESDMKALSAAGVNCIRIYPLWNLMQPEPDHLDPAFMENMDQVISTAGSYGIAVQISALTGIMSGGIFMPKWAGGNIFTDPELISKEVFLVNMIAERYRNNPVVCAYDFGNEINVLRRKLNLQASAEEIDNWMKTIYSGFIKGDPAKPVTNGIGTGYENLWKAENIASSSDFFSSHSYIDSHRTNLVDPYIGMRTTYSLNCLNAWSRMTGKPVMAQQIAIPSTKLPEAEAAKFLRITMMSSWGEGDIGYIWWCSHNIDPGTKISTDGLFPNGNLKDNRVSKEDQVMGLLDENNRPKVFTADFTACATLAGKLGPGWKNLLPVCYILVREGDEQKSTMLYYINPYVLAKQAHMHVRFLLENMPVPADAACLVIPGFHLGEEGKAPVRNYLAKGGSVYQSVFNDFSDDIQAKGEEMKLKEAGANPVFVSIQVEKGTYFYLSANPEKALTDTYDPWESDNSGLIYSILKPESEINIDSKFVELVYREKEQKKILMLINHANKTQKVKVSCMKKMKLSDVLTKKQLADGRSFTLKLDPGEVITGYVR